MDPILSNLAAVAGCSILNFLAGNTLVFRAVPPMAVAVLIGTGTPAWAGPSPAALQAWKSYEALVDSRHAETVRAGGAARWFFVHDRLEKGEAWRASVLRGEIETTEIGSPPVEGAAIHHWAGAVFLPGTSLEQVLRLLKNGAGREAELYEDVMASRLLWKDGNRLSVFMRLRRKTALTAIYNTEHLVEYFPIGKGRASSRSVATRIAEVQDAGEQSEREKRMGEDRGFLWRLNAYWRYLETDGGVLVECESVSLSRSVPTLARPVVSPVVKRVARESMARTLRAVRSAVSSLAANAEGLDPLLHGSAP
jgi:hypothetical protein